MKLEGNSGSRSGLGGVREIVGMNMIKMHCMHEILKDLIKTVLSKKLWKQSKWGKTELLCFKKDRQTCLWPISPFFLTGAGSIALPPHKEGTYLLKDFLQEAQAQASLPPARGIALKAMNGSSLGSETFITETLTLVC